MELSLKKLKLRVHPLFLAVGALSAFTGGLFLFLAAFLAALEHECAHAIVARRYGYTLDKIVLMPYGAVVKGDLSGIGRRAELAVLLAGPLCNLATGFFFVALWWLYPECYPYTELAAQVSFSLFFVNLLPAYPLDGGRLVCLLFAPLGKRKARIAGMVCSFAVILGILGYFIATCFSSPNYAALLFCLFLCCSFGGGRYGRVVFSAGRLRHGVEERRVCVDGGMTAGEAVRFLREDRYLTLLLFEDGEFSAELSEEELVGALSAGRYSDPLLALTA